VLAVSENKKLISNTHDRREKIREHALAKNSKKMPSDSTVRRWYQRWRAHDYENAGVLSRKGGNREQRINEAVEVFVQQKIHDDYMSEQRISVVELEKKIRGGMKADPVLCKQPVPSLKTIYRRVDEIAVYDRVSARHGRDVAQQRYPSGLPVRQPRYPFERFELDHTPIDLIVIDEVTKKTLGRAWATFLIDAFTRMVVGFYISMKAPSRKSVVAAIKHAISPKAYVKTLYPEIKTPYPCWGACSTLVVDNGRDLHANDAKRVMAELNLVVQYCPRKRPNYKGKIERFLKTFNYQFIHLLPGTTFANYLAKADYKVKEIISFDRLIELIHHWVIDEYHNTEHRALGISPLAFWNQNRHAFSNPVLFDSVDRLDQLMWTEFTGSIQKDGVRRHNLFWNSKGLQDIAKQYGHKTKIDVLMDEDDLSMARVRIPHTNELIDVANTKPDYTEGLSLHSHELICKDLSKNYGSPDQISEQALMTARRRREELVAEAVVAAKSKSKKSTKGGAMSSDDVVRSISKSPKSKAPKKPKPIALADVSPIIPDNMEIE
jgi:putative transposase